MQTRRWALGLPVLGAIAACSVAVGTAGADGNAAAVVTTKGSDGFFAPNPAQPPNKLLINNLQWTPGTITMHSGQSFKLIYGSDKSGEPHVLAIASKKDLPKSPNLSPHNKVVQLIAPKLLINPANPAAGFKAYKANRGRDGLNVEGDALVILPGGPHKTATWFVSAKPGVTLYYFCAVHPWMQGKIKVVN